MHWRSGEDLSNPNPRVFIMDHKEVLSVVVIGVVVGALRVVAPSRSPANPNPPNPHSPNPNPRVFIVDHKRSSLWMLKNDLDASLNTITIKKTFSNDMGLCGE